MNALMLVLYAIANLVIFVMLGCMLQSKFIASGIGFRFVIGLLAAASIGCTFYGLAGGPIGFGQAAQSLFLAVALVMMRLRQVREGEHEHPTERAASRRARLEQYVRLKG